MEDSNYNNINISSLSRTPPEGGAEILVKKLGGTLGMARKAGKLQCGTETVNEAVRRGKARLVLMASDISANTRKRIENCCKYYKTEYGDIEMTMELLSHFTGQKAAVAAVAITDKGFTAMMTRDEYGAVVKRNIPREV